MNNSKKIKSIAFRMQLEGNGVVNFDGDEQKNILKFQCGTSINDAGGKHGNYKFAKKEFFELPKEEQTERKKFGYRLKISSECLRHAIFNEPYNPAMVTTDPILAHHTFSPSRLLQGWMWTYPSGTRPTIIKRSALSMSHASSDAVPFLEIQTQDIPKEKTNDDSSTSLYYRENVGHVTYNVDGFIDIERLQFLSADPFFGRMAVDASWMEGNDCLMDKTFMNLYGRVPYKKGWWQSTTALLSRYVGEYGVKFDNEFVASLLKELLKRLLHINITRSTAYAKTAKLEINLNPLSDGEWIELTEEMIDELSFDNMYEFYTEVSEEDANATRQEITKNYAAVKELDKKKGKGKGKSKETDNESEE